MRKQTAEKTEIIPGTGKRGRDMRGEQTLKTRTKNGIKKHTDAGKRTGRGER